MYKQSVWEGVCVCVIEVDPMRSRVKWSMNIAEPVAGSSRLPRATDWHLNAVTHYITYIYSLLINRIANSFGWIFQNVLLKKHNVTLIVIYANQNFLSIHLTKDRD